MTKSQCTACGLGATATVITGITCYLCSATGSSDPTVELHNHNHHEEDKNNLPNASEAAKDNPILEPNTKAFVPPQVLNPQTQEKNKVNPKEQDFKNVDDEGGSLFSGLSNNSIGKKYRDKFLDITDPKSTWESKLRILKTNIKTNNPYLPEDWKYKGSDPGINVIQNKCKDNYSQVKWDFKQGLHKSLKEQHWSFMWSMCHKGYDEPPKGWGYDDGLLKSR